MREKEKLRREVVALARGSQAAGKCLRNHCLLRPLPPLPAARQRRACSMRQTAPAACPALEGRVCSSLPHSLLSPFSAVAVASMAGVATFAYNTLFKKTSTFVAGAVFLAFFFERGVDSLTDSIFDSINRGVSVLCVLPTVIPANMRPVHVYRSSGRTSSICTRSSMKKNSGVG